MKGSTRLFSWGHGEWVWGAHSMPGSVQGPRLGAQHSMAQRSTAQHAQRTWMELPSAMPMDRSILFLAATNTACRTRKQERLGASVNTTKHAAGPACSCPPQTPPARHRHGQRRAKQTGTQACVACCSTATCCGAAAPRRAAAAAPGRTVKCSVTFPAMGSTIKPRKPWLMFSSSDTSSIAPVSISAQKR